MSDNRADLILGLSQAMKGDNSTANKRQFDADTNTLITGNVGGIHEVNLLVSKEEFTRIASGLVKHHITDRRGITDGTDVIFNEVEADQFTKTGHRIIKRAITVLSYLQEPGLKEGYSIITF